MLFEINEEIVNTIRKIYGRNITGIPQYKLEIAENVLSFTTITLSLMCTHILMKQMVDGESSVCLNEYYIGEDIISPLLHYLKTTRPFIFEHVNSATEVTIKTQQWLLSLSDKKLLEALMVANNTRPI